jgi:CysZ protein
MLARIWTGMTYLRRAWVLCGELKMRWLLAVPMVLNVALVFLLFRYGLMGAISRAVIDIIAEQVSTTATVLLTIVTRFVDILIVVLVTYTAVRFSAIIASPVYGVIAERVSDALLPGQTFPTRSWAADIMAAIGYESKKFILTLVGAGIALVVSFIPLFGPTLNVSWSIAVALTFVCFDFTDASFSRRGQNIRTRARELSRVLPEALGFAVIALPLVSIPILNLFTLPWCCAAGMYLATEAHRRAERNT